MRRSWEGNVILAAVLLIAAAGLVLLAASRWSAGPPLLVLFLLISAAIIAAAAVGILAGVIEQYTDQRERNRASEAAAWERAQPEVARIEAMTQLVTRLQTANPTVLQILAGDPMLAKIIAGNFGPNAAVITKDGEVPYSFVDEWWAANKDKDVLIAVNQWPTTGGKRQYASWIERHLIALHFLVTWRGTRTAQWESDGAKIDFLEAFYGERINQQHRNESASPNEDKNDI